MGMPVPKTSRREFAVSAGASILAATAGVVYGSRDAKAVDIGVNNLSIEKQTASAPQAPTEVLLVIDGEWHLDSNVVPDKLVIIPSAQVKSSVMGMHEFSHVEVTEIGAKQASGEFTTKLDLRALQALRDAFPATEGASVTKSVVVELLVGARKDGTQIGAASTREQFDLTLHHAVASAAVGFDAIGRVKLKQ